MRQGYSRVRTNSEVASARESMQLGTWLAAGQRIATGRDFILGPSVSRYDESLTLIGVLDQLREAYDLAKGLEHPELQAHLMTARRKLVQALHQNLKLHSQLEEAQERLAQQQTRESIRGEHPVGVLLTPLSDPTIRRRTS